LSSEKGGGDEGAWGHERFDEVMRAGIESHRWTIQNLHGKAKAVLTAGTIVLGIMMGGLGTAGGLAGEHILAGWQLLREQNECAAVLIAACVAGSLVSICASVFFAAGALGVRRVRDFGRASIFMEGDKVNHKNVAKWVSAKETRVYERTHEAYVRELRSLEEQNADVGRQVRWSHHSLRAGILLGVAGAVAFLAVALSA